MLETFEPTGISYIDTCILTYCKQTLIYNYLILWFTSNYQQHILKQIQETWKDWV